MLSNIFDLIVGDCMHVQEHQESKWNTTFIDSSGQTLALVGPKIARLVAITSVRMLSYTAFMKKALTRTFVVQARQNVSTPRI